MRATAEWIDGRVMIPELLRRAPQVRAVLDRYGLRGCGGPEGPAESLAFFAQAHEIALPVLLAELRTAERGPMVPVAVEPPNRTDAIYRPFFRAGIVATLTAGAVWGAYLLLRIAWGGSFRAVGVHEVNAHGHAQIFGWVGLFVMGFAYQAFPRFKHARLALPRLAWASLWLMGTGLVVRSVLEPLAGPGSWAAVGAVTAAGLEVLAVLCCAVVVVATWRAAGKPLAVYDGYILAALGWFLVQAVFEAVYLWATLAATGSELVHLVVTWQGALRDVQIHGFALLMILGVSQRLFPHFYGLPAPSRRLSLAALFLLNAAVVGEVLAMVCMHGAPAWRGVWYASVLVLAGTVAALVVNWGIFGRIPANPDGTSEADRSLKFLRAGYVWLLVSLAMLVMLPFWQHGLLPRLAPASEAAQLGFSHAYYGAIRHAVTVGFVSLMIVGVASRVVPTLNGLDVRKLSGLWVPFVLLNAGCTLRVVGQTLTDLTSTAFPFAGVSGLLEVTGLTLWGVHLWRIMSGHLRSDDGEALAPGEPIAAHHRVAAVLDRYPDLLATFQAFGFHALANPTLRQTVARHVTIAQACRMMGVDLRQLLTALNIERERCGTRSLALPVMVIE